MSKKVVFLGSKPIGYECFKHLISQQKDLNVEIVGLLTQTRSEFDGSNNLVELAVANSIPCLQSLDDIPACDIIYSVQYHQLLKQEHIEKAAQIALNLHMAPLPEYRGSNQFSIAIINEAKEFGTTIHQINTKIDNGPILFQKRFSIPADCWVAELYELTFEASFHLFKETIVDILSGKYKLKPQQQLETTYGTSLHFKNEINQLKEIDLSWEKDKIEKYIRATSMPGFEPPYCIINGAKVYFTPSDKHE